MKTLPCILALNLCLAGAAEESRLDNGLLGVTVMPQSMGRVVSLKDKISGRELLKPYRQQRVSVDPLLPPQTEWNRMGFFDRLWGVKEYTPLPMSVNEKATPNKLMMSADHYLNSDWHLRREISLPPDSSCLEFSAEFINSTDRKHSLTPWLTLIPSEQQDMRVIMPGVSGLTVIDRKTDNSQTTKATAPWCAVAWTNPSPILLVMASDCPDFVNNGSLYSWQGLMECGRMRTMEMILPRITLPPGGTFTHRYRLMTFHGLDNIQTLVNDCALTLETSSGTVPTLNIASCRIFPGGIINGKLSADNGKTFRKIKLECPPLHPGSHIKLPLPLNMNEISGSINIDAILPCGTSFTLSCNAAKQNPR